MKVLNLEFRSQGPQCGFAEMWTNSNYYITISKDSEGVFEAHYDTRYAFGSTPEEALSNLLAGLKEQATRLLALVEKVGG